MKKKHVLGAAIALTLAAAGGISAFGYNYYNTVSAAEVSDTSSSDVSLDDLKVLTFLGDSITYGWDTDKAYEYFLGEYLDADTVYNYGQGGTTLSDGADYLSKDNMIERAAILPADSDLIFVLGGSNDWAYNVELGEMGDTDPTTFYGALDTLMSYLLENYPDAEIIFATPLQRIDWLTKYPHLTNEDGVSENSSGHTLEEYANAVLEVAEKYGITVIDLFHAEETDFTSDTDYTLYWSDGLHPNAYGDELMADYIYEQLLALYA